MKKFYLQVRYGCVYALLFSLLFSISNNSNGQQIWQPEGLCVVGDISASAWTFPPPANSPLGSEFQVSGGGVKLRATGVRRWHSSYQSTVASGTQDFLFVSNGFSNKWGGANIVFNTLQASVFGSGSNNSMTTVNGKWYSFNWRDNGYQNTDAVYMETDNAPVTVSSTSQAPLAANVTPADPVVVTVNTNLSLSPQENVYIRYTTNSYSTSTLVQATMVGNSGTATIPAQVDGTTVQYYAMTSTASIAQIGTNYDMFTINSGGGSSYTSTALPPVMVSFRVDMANEVVSGSGVHIAGSFNSFNPASTQLTLISGTIYGITIPLAQNSTIQYKFINGNSWGQDESVPGACNVGGNREFTIADQNVTIPLHCYASCVACVPKVNVKFSVNMSGLTVDGAGVHLAGDFGSAYPVWNPGGILLTNEGGGIYSTTLQLIPGNYYSYKYVNGDAWGKDEGVPGGCNVSGNRQVYASPGGLNIPVHCFGTCNNCVAVTFRVNMTGQTIGGGGVHVAGSFQGWNPASTALNFVGGGIYETTVNMDLGQSFQYKFVNGNAWGQDEGVPGVCQSGGNRFGSVGSSNKVLPTVCYTRCIDCDATSVWTGQNDGNFNNGNNWTAGVAPSGCNINVRIKSGVTQPTLNGTASARSLSFENGASLNIASGQLNVCENIVGGGFNSVQITGSGKVVLNGTTAQTISGLLTVPSLEVNNSAGVSLNSGSTLRITNTMKLFNGTFNAALGNLKFISTPTSEARLLKTEAGASLVGPVSFQKHLPGIAPGKGAWFFVGSPVGGTQLNEFAQGGNTFAPATYEASNYNPASLYVYSQTSSAIDNNFGWAKASAGSDVLAAGRGIRVWAKENFLNERGYYNFQGAVNSGSVNFPISYCPGGCSYPDGGATNGWNLLANPYPCPIDWNVGAGWTKTGIAGNAIYVWNADQEKYSTYDGSVGTFGGTKNIATGQSFFVQALNGGAALQVNEDAKIDTYYSGMRSAVSEIAGIRIEVASNNQTDDVWLDLGADRLNVAVSKFTNPGLNLSLVGPAKSYAIAGKNTVENGNVIPLGLKGTLGVGSLRLVKSGELADYQVYLKDDFNGTLTELSASETNVPFSASTIDNNRFSLVVNPVVLSTGSKIGKAVLKTWPNPVKNQLFVEKSTAPQTYSIFEITGKKLSSGVLDAGQQVISTDELPVGQYILQVGESTGKFVKY
jgi:hypothetical protein